MRRKKANVFLLVAALAAAAIVGLVAVNLADAQCPGGNCRGGQCPSPRIDVGVWAGARRPAVKVEVEGHSRPAWRYERPTGHRAAVVRIFCQDDVRTRSVGSGVLVRWGKRILVLTARHVVMDAKKIIVENWKKKTHWATVLKVDATWDCAVLELTSTPEGVEPAELEYGDEAMQHEGSRLESCGYGPDGKLAANSGLFIGYRRSNQNPQQGTDDWMVISGHARGGDSGGPVFNERGRVVGVLWGTDGKEVVCVQAGRVHATIEAAVQVLVEEKSFRLLSETGLLQRNPTPAMPGPEPYAPMVPVPPQSAEQSSHAKKPMLPWRGEAEGRDKSQKATIDRMIELDRLRQEQLNSESARPPVVAAPVPSMPVEPPPAKEEALPLFAGLAIAGGVLAGFVLYFASQKGT